MIYLRLALAAGLLLGGWYARTVYQGYIDNEAAEEAIAAHNVAVKKDESAGLMFGQTLDGITQSTNQAMKEIARADLKPKPQVIYAEVPGSVTCPVSTQFTPDWVRLYNGEAVPPDANGGVR